MPLDYDNDPPAIEGSGRGRRSDEDIERALVSAFAPHRCEVEFQDDGERIAMTLYALDGREFFVAAKRLKSLRDPHALDEYVRDIQNCLGRHGMAFNQQVRTRRDD